MPPDASRSLLLRSVFLPAIAAALAACGSSAECVLDTDCALPAVCEANVCTAPMLPPPMDLGRPDMGQSDAAMPDAAMRDASVSATLTGTFFAESTTTASTVGAFFAESAPPPGPCTTRTDGPCEVTVCTSRVSTVTRPAGTLSLSGGTMAVSLTPNGDNTYTTAVGATQLFAEGTALMFDGSGADGGVPAFSGMVTTPGQAMLSVPAIVDATPLAISRMAAFAVTWVPSVPATAGTVNVRFSAVAVGGASASARCRFPLADAAGSIPATVFTDFPAGSSGSYSFYVEAERELTLAGGWKVTAIARSPLSTAGGVVTSGAATF